MIQTKKLRLFRITSVSVIKIFEIRICFAQFYTMGDIRISDLYKFDNKLLPSRVTLKSGPQGQVLYMY